MQKQHVKEHFHEALSHAQHKKTHAFIHTATQKNTATGIYSRFTWGGITPNAEAARQIAISRGINSHTQHSKTLRIHTYSNAKTYSDGNILTICRGRELRRMQKWHVKELFHEA